MDGIEILSQRDLEYFQQKAKGNPNIKIIHLTEEELLHLDISKVMKGMEEQVIDADSVREWVRENIDSLQADYKESEEILKECRELEKMAIQGDDRTKAEGIRAEEAIERISDDEKREIVYRAVMEGLGEEELDMLLNLEDAVQMKVLYEMLVKMKKKG